MNLHNWKSILFIFLLLPNFTRLKSEAKEETEPWIKKGRIFYELGLAYQTITDPRNTTNFYAKNYYRYFDSIDARDRLIGIAGFVDSQKEIQIDGNNQKLNLEYMVNSWIGVGGSLQNSFIHVSGLSKNDTELNDKNYANLQSITYFFPEIAQISNFFNIYGILPDKKEILNIRTYDYDVTFHLPTDGNLDTYFRISAGRGFLTEGLILRTGWSTGLKWKLDPSLFLSSEVYQSRILSKQNNNEADQFLELGIRFGFGFYSTWPK